MNQFAHPMAKDLILKELEHADAHRNQHNAHTDSFQEEANRIAELSGLDRNSAEMLLGMYDQGCQSQVERTREFVNSIPA
jgi:hypothetical protein